MKTITKFTGLVALLALCTWAVLAHAVNNPTWVAGPGGVIMANAWEAGAPAPGSSFTSNQMAMGTVVSGVETVATGYVASFPITVTSFATMSGNTTLTCRAVTSGGGVSAGDYFSEQFAWVATANATTVTIQNAGTVTVGPFSSSSLSGITASATASGQTVVLQVSTGISAAAIDCTLASQISQAS